MDFFVDIGCALQMIFLKLMKKIAVRSEILFQRQEVSGNKANTSETPCKQMLTQ